MSLSGRVRSSRSLGVFIIFWFLHVFQEIRFQPEFLDYELRPVAFLRISLGDGSAFNLDYLVIFDHSGHLRQWLGQGDDEEGGLLEANSSQKRAIPSRSQPVEIAGRGLHSRRFEHKGCRRRRTESKGPDSGMPLMYEKRRPGQPTKS